MNKQQFIDRLKEKLSDLPNAEASDRISFYLEMVDDKKEEGFAEEDVFEDILSSVSIPDEATKDILQESANGDEKRKRRPKAWEIVLLALGSPIWLSLLISVAAVIFSLYVSLWSVIVALWAACISLAICPIALLAYGIAQIICGNAVSGLFFAGCGIVCAGLAIFLYVGCLELTKCTVRLTKWMFRLVKRKHERTA